MTTVVSTICKKPKHMHKKTFEKQHKILMLLSEGKDVKMIAEELQLTEKKVNKHIGKIQKESSVPNILNKNIFKCPMKKKSISLKEFKSKTDYESDTSSDDSVSLKKPTKKRKRKAELKLDAYDENKMRHLDLPILKNYADAARLTYSQFPYGASESTYQSAFQKELNIKGIETSRETVTSFHARSSLGKVYAVPDGNYGREDLTDDDNRIVSELKNVNKLDSKEFNQITRYLYEKQHFNLNCTHGRPYKGLLINFGLTELEIWLITFNFQKNKYEHIRLIKEDKIEEEFDVYEYLI